jgi:general secretion pathway protein G
MTENNKADKKIETGDSILIYRVINGSQKEGSCGFTLIELIMVVAILGILAIMSIPSFKTYLKTTKVNVCASDLRVIDKAITAYIMEKNALPTSLSDVGMNNQLDPWKRPYVYQNLSLGGTPLQDFSTIDLNTDYDLYSKGEDDASSPAGGGAGNEDDVVRSNDGSYAGLRP